MAPIRTFTIREAGVVMLVAGGFMAAVALLFVVLTVRTPGPGASVGARESTRASMEREVVVWGTPTGLDAATVSCTATRSSGSDAGPVVPAQGEPLTDGRWVEIGRWQSPDAGPSSADITCTGAGLERFAISAAPGTRSYLGIAGVTGILSVVGLALGTLLVRLGRSRTPVRSA